MGQIQDTLIKTKEIILKNNFSPIFHLNKIKSNQTLEYHQTLFHLYQLRLIPVLSIKKGHLRFLIFSDPQMHILYCYLVQSDDAIQKLQERLLFDSASVLSQ
mgnify:CR=1 FL=1